MNADQFAQLLAGVQQALGGQHRDSTKLMAYNNDKEEMTWVNWRQHFLTVRDTCEWNNLRSRRQLKIAMKGEAATMVSDLNVVDFNDLNAMLDAFEARFVPAAEGNLVHAEFRAARQQPGERRYSNFIPVYEPYSSAPTRTTKSPITAI